VDKISEILIIPLSWIVKYDLTNIITGNLWIRLPNVMPRHGTLHFMEKWYYQRSCCKLNEGGSGGDGGGTKGSAGETKGLVACSKEKE